MKFHFREEQSDTSEDEDDDDPYDFDAPPITMEDFFMKWAQFQIKSVHTEVASAGSGL
jgi:hypothetical protein